MGEAGPKYKFKNVIMVSSCWSEVEKVKKMVETAKGFGTKFYACYSDCDIGGTITFTDVHMKEYLEEEPWHLPAIGGHGQTVWDAFTYDGDGNGKADILETIFGNSSEKVEDDITDKNGEIDPAPEPELEPETLNEQDLEKQDIDKTVGTYRRPAEEPNYDFAKVCKIAMEKGITFKSGEKPSEFIKRVAEKLNIPTTTLQEGTFGETPLLNQLDFQEKETGLCGPTSLCMLASAALGYEYTPADLYADFPDINKYRDGMGGFGDGLFKDEKILERLNLSFENEDGKPYFGNAWGDYFTPEDGLLMKALREGKRAIWNTQKNIFTKSGHYLEVELKNDKIWINDPNGGNYLSNNPTLIDILNNGCDPKELRKYGGRFYIFDVANTGNTNASEKSDEVLIKEILEAFGYNSQNSTEEPNQTSVVEPVTEPVTEPITEPVAEPVNEPATEPVNEPATEPVAEPVTEPVTELVTEPITEPITEPTTKNDTTTSADRRTPEKPTDGFVDVCKIAMEIDKKLFEDGPTPSELTRRVAEKLNIPTTTNGNSKDYETLIKEIIDKNKKIATEPNDIKDVGYLPIVDNELNPILKVAESFANETSSSNYICSVLYQAGYLTQEKLNEYKNYTIDDIFKKFDELGWEKVTKINNLQVGDVVLIDNNGEKIVQIYAGDNKWYIQGQSKPQKLTNNDFDNLTWQAYRPQK